jgi:hypothetical protein
MRKVDTNIWRIKVCMRRDFQGGNLPMDITKYFIQFQNPEGMWKRKDQRIYYVQDLLVCFKQLLEKGK